MAEDLLGLRPWWWWRRLCSRKKGKTNRLSESEKILLGYYIRLRPGSQESRVYLGTKRLRRGKQINRNFGIKSFYPKIGGHVFTQKFGKKDAGTRKLLRLCHQGIDCIRIDISWFRCGTRISSLWMTSADNDNELRLASGNMCRTLQKGKEYQIL